MFTSTNVYHSSEGRAVVVICKEKQNQKTTAQLQTRGCFTLSLGYELFSLLKTLLWVWNVKHQ